MLHFWDQDWDLHVEQCPCDVHLLEWLEQETHEKLGPLSFGKRDELVFLGREIGEQRNYSDDVAKTMGGDEKVTALQESLNKKRAG